LRRLLGGLLIAGAAGVLTLLLGLSPAGARAGVLTTCASSANLITVSVPHYARRGAPVRLVLGAVDATRVSEAQVTLLVGRTVISTTPVTLTEASTDLTLPAPARGTPLTVAVAWNQDTGAASACSGIAVAKLPLIPARATAGDPTAPRLSGPFAVVEVPFHYGGADSRPVWRFFPACDYYACAVTLQSSEGLSLALARSSHGIYHGFIRADAAQTATSCTVAHRHLATIKHAYVLREDVYVRVRASADGFATAISGSLIARYTPTRAARRQGCVLKEQAIERLTGHR
jgi:hypothetical protein